MFCSALDACLAPPARQGQPSPATQPANPLRQPSILKPTVAGHSDIDYFPEVPPYSYPLTFTNVNSFFKASLKLIFKYVHICIKIPQHIF